MSERLAVDSLMTADGEVVQLPTLGPLGPVDAEGGRIPLDTKELFDAHGECRKVESYEFMSNRIAWGSLMAESLGQAVSMLASSWNRR